MQPFDFIRSPSTTSERDAGVNIYIHCEQIRSHFSQIFTFGVLISEHANRVSFIFFQSHNKSVKNKGTKQLEETEIYANSAGVLSDLLWKDQQ